MTQEIDEMIEYAQAVLQAGVAHPRWEIAFSAAEALAHTNRGEGSQILQQGLQTSSGFLRDRSIIALSKLKQQQFHPLFAACLNDEDPLVRAHALEATVLLLKEGALDHILSSLQDSNDFVKESAVVALSWLNPKNSHPILESIARNHPPYQLVYPLRISAAYFLAQQDNRAGKQILIEGLRCGDEWGQFLAARNLASLGYDEGKKELEKMARVGGWEEKIMALQSLLELGEELELEKVYRPSEAPDLLTKIKAAAVLYHKFPQSVETILLEALESEEEKLQDCAIETIGKLEHPELIELLTGILEGGKEHQRAMAVLTIEKIGDASSIPYLAPVLEISHWLLRLQTAKAVLLLKEKNNQLA